MRPRHIFASSALALLASAALSAPAAAVDWGTLTATYNNQNRAQAYGSFYNENYQYARNDFVLKDINNDGNNVYGHTDFYWYGQNSACGSDDLGHNNSCWFGGSRISTGEINYTQRFRVSVMRKNLDAFGTQARGKSTVCVQLGWPVPDHCAASAYPTFSY